MRTGWTLNKINIILAPTLKTEFQWFTMLYGTECSLLVIITRVRWHVCVIITKKMHEITYHTVNHWSEA